MIIHVKYYKNDEIITKQYRKSNNYHTKHKLGVNILVELFNENKMNDSLKIECDTSRKLKS